jgi:tRNA A-37 threonylcarbamoyl transferase component Bud32
MKIALSSVQFSLLWVVSFYASRARNLTRELRQNAYPRVKEQLESLWRAGICHGDVAWRNVAVSDCGDVMLLDLGLSRCMATDAARSEDLRSVEELCYGF